MENVKYYAMTVTTGNTGTTQIYTGQHDQLLMYVPALSTWGGSSAVGFRVQGSYQSGTSAKTNYIYDYINATPKECLATISTGGMYELPFAGGVGNLRIEYDVAATQATTIYLVIPRGGV